MARTPYETDVLVLTAMEKFPDWYDTKFLPRVVDGPDDERWWDGYVNPFGYGRLYVPRVGHANVHRVALLHHLGRPITPGMTVDHVCHEVALAAGRCPPGPCDHRRCVNTDHLCEETFASNLGVGGARSGLTGNGGRAKAARQAARASGEILEPSAYDREPIIIARRWLGIGFKKFHEVFGTTTTWAPTHGRAVLTLRDAGWTPEQVIATGVNVRAVAAGIEVSA